jgi:hypothetical protein
MTRPRFLFILLAAACALATTAGPASAFFHAEKYPVKSHAQNKAAAEKFLAGTAKFSCTSAHYYGTAEQTADSSQAPSQPEYVDGVNSKNLTSTCKTEAFGISAKPKIKTGQCVYNLHQAKGALAGQVSVECPAGESIVFETNLLGCIVTVPTQLYLPGVTYVNQAGPPKTVDVQDKTPIKVVYNAACKTAGLKELEAVLYEGEAKAEAQNSAGTQIGCEVI